MRANICCLVVPAVVAFAIGCAGKDPQGPGAQIRNATLKMQAGDSQYATVGRPVPISPSVVLIDNSGPVSGAKVTFRVTSGGGSATGTEAITDTAGFASVGSWTLGPEIGPNTMTATVVGSDSAPIVFTEIAMCDCWKSKASLPDPRYNGGSAVIDGKLYVAGSNGWDMQLPLEVYDPSTDTWNSLGLLPKIYDVAVAALGGQLYLMAGLPTSTPNTWIRSYDPATDEWADRTAPPTQRSQFRIAALGGLLYVLGGLGEGGELPTVEAYDPATDTWTTKAPMPRGRVWMDVAVVNGILYVIGGDVVDNIQGVWVDHGVSTVEAYDPVTDTWTEKAPFPVPIMESAAAVVDGIIYVTGGGPYYSAGSANVWAYDPSKDRWAIQPPMPMTVFCATASALDGAVYVIGGIGPNIPLTTVIAFRPSDAR